MILVLWELSVGDACFCKFLLMLLASGFDAGSAGVFCLGCLFLQVLLMIQASAVDAGSAWVFCLGMLVSASFC